MAFPFSVYNIAHPVARSKEFDADGINCENLIISPIDFILQV